MNDTLTVPKDKVLEAYSKAKSPRKVMLENLFGLKTFQPDIMKRVIEFDDVCREMGKNPKDYICTSDDPDDIAANALRQALLISRCFNADKKEVVDWANDNQRKYFHWYVYSPSSGWSLDGIDCWCTLTSCGSRLCFESSEKAKYAGNQFEDLYKAYFVKA